MRINLMAATLMTAAMAMAQVAVPDGTKIRVRLEERLSSETAEVGSTVEFAVTREVRINNAIVIPYGARATGTVVTAQARRRLGRGGELDFTIDRVQLVDGTWVNVRYTALKAHGKGNGVKTGVLTAGLAVVFWPAAPLGLLVKGHEATANQGRTYEVFLDDSVTLAMGAPAVAAAPRLLVPAPAALEQASIPEIPQGTPATITVNANQPGADIEVDGRFVGSAPSTIQLAPGVHRVVVRQGASMWQRDLQVSGGNITISAVLVTTAAP